MTEPSRIQIGLYVALAGAILVVGIGALRAGEDRPDSGVTGGEAEAAGPRWTGPDGGGRETGEIGAGLTVDDHGGSALVVHVAGEVERPGLYRLPVGARVGAAVRNAGGGTSEALLDGINLAARLADGQQVVIPAQTPVAAAADRPAPGPAASGPVSLGTATATDLESIDGIGPVTAEKILEFRDSNGGLASVEDLIEVHGIGPTTVERLRDELTP